MRAVVQRVTQAKVEVDGKVTGEIKKGFLVLVGFTHGDTEADCIRVAKKISGLRIFSDENDKINLSLKDVEGDILCVSQFTLYADCSHGNRPSFTNAARPDLAEPLRIFLQGAGKIRSHRAWHFRSGYEGLAVKRRSFHSNYRVNIFLSLSVTRSDRLFLCSNSAKVRR